MAIKTDSAIHAGYGVLAVAITAGVASIWGQSWAVAVLGAAASALAILGCDHGLDRARRRYTSVREAIDDRAFLEGAWLQLDVRILRGDLETENRFGIFVLTFNAALDTYTVDGTAYFANGAELAHWASPKQFGLQVSADRSSANYDLGLPQVWLTLGVGGSQAASAAL